MHIGRLELGVVARVGERTSIQWEMENMRQYLLSRG